MRIGVGLSIPELATRGGRFSPASLFTSGVAGAWYDPSDYSTLFQDSAGTTPVTAVEQPVGLMLDKSQGLVLGSELVTNGGPDFTSTTGWTGTSSNGAAPTLSIVSGWFRVTPNGTSGGWGSTTITYPASWIAVTVQWRTSGGASAARVTTYFPGIDTDLSGTSGTQTFYLTKTGGSGEVRLHCKDATGYVEYRVISIKSIAGNHASQATAASRPVLRARYNLLTYSEQFDNAAWVKSNFNAFGSGSVANTTATTDPIGGNTADFLQLSTAANVIHNALIQPSTSASTVYTQSVYFKAAGYSKVGLREGVSTGAYATADLSTGSIIASGLGASGAFCTSVGNGWYRVGFTFTSGAGALSGVQVFAMDSGYASGTPAVYTFTANGTDGIYAWGAQIVTGSSAGTYQRIAAATDYATAGFLPYLAFDGVDDFLGAAYVQSAYPLTITSGVDNTIGVSNTGIVSVAQTDSAYKQLRDDSGNTTAAQDRNAGLITPTSIVVNGNKFCLAQFETSLVTHQVNGGTASTLANTNAFGTSANIFVGKTRPAGLFSSARNYGAVITNTVLTAAEKDSLKNWMAVKMGVTL